MILTLNRQPHDEWYFNLFNELAIMLPNDSDAIYLWALDSTMDQLKEINFKTRIVLLFITDNLQLREYDVKSQIRTVHAQTLLDIAKQYPATTFIISNELVYLDREIWADNIHLICHGGMQIEQDRYCKLSPVTEKNFDSTEIYICLNHTVKHSRTTTVSYLLGSEFETTGHITFNYPKLTLDTWFDSCNWVFNNTTRRARRTIDAGYDLLKSGQGIYYTTPDLKSVYEKTHNQNSENFEQFLRKLYTNSFVEIVTETGFPEPAIILTEKYINSVFGCNFPILIAGYGTVEHLRTVGFDVFDDVVNHSYDSIVDPIERLITAIDLNERLLTDGPYVKSLWNKHRDRFLKNVGFAKTGLYNYYRNNVLTSMNRILNDK
jgi:hypothetical protein